MNYVAKLVLMDGFSPGDILEHIIKQFSLANLGCVVPELIHRTKKGGYTVNPQLERQLSQFLCEKVLLYTSFTSFSS